MTRVDLPEKVTLEECSLNDNQEPVTHLQNMVYRFDDISQDEGNKYPCDEPDYMDCLSGICAYIGDTDIKNVKRIPDRNFYQACLMYFCADSVVASPPWLVSLRQAGI